MNDLRPGDIRTFKIGGKDLSENETQQGSRSTLADIRYLSLIHI